MDERIDEIIAKKLSHGLTAGEESELMAWLKKPGNEQRFNQLMKTWDISGELVFNSDWNTDKEWAQFNILRQQTQKTKRLSLAGIGWITAAAAAVIFIVIIISPFQPRVNTYLAHKSGEMVDLPDGSTVTLKKGAEIQYLKGFEKKHRQIQLAGEAFFKVQKSIYPFEISTDGCLTRVVGTEFNLRANEGKTELFVTEGIVAFRAGASDEIKVQANQWALCTSDKGIVAFDSMPDVNHVSWLSDNLRFFKTPLQSVIEDIGRHFDKNFYIDEAIESLQFTGSFESPKLIDLLEIVSLSTNTTFAIRNDSILILK